jgi:hypothetical protein
MKATDEKHPLKKNPRGTDAVYRSFCRDAPKGLNPSLRHAGQLTVHSFLSGVEPSSGDQENETTSVSFSLQILGHSGLILGACRCHAKVLVCNVFSLGRSLAECGILERTTRDQWVAPPTTQDNRTFAPSRFRYHEPRVDVYWHFSSRVDHESDLERRQCD